MRLFAWAQALKMIRTTSQCLRGRSPCMGSVLESIKVALASRNLSMLSAVPQFTRNLVAPWNMFHIMCDQGTVDDDLPNHLTLLGMELPYIEGGLSPGKESQCCKEKGYRLLDNVTIRSPPPHPRYAIH